jgi:hypothetical protein
MNPFQDGYYAGLVNDRECPTDLSMVAAMMWEAGNDIGVRIHCLVVEAAYLSHPQD